MARSVQLSVGLVALLVAVPVLAATKDLGPYGAEVQVAWSPDGKLLAVTTRGCNAQLVDPATEKKKTRFKGDEDAQESALAFSPDGTRVALACQEGVAWIYDAASAAVVTTILHGGSIRSLAFTSDGKALVTGGWQPHLAEDPDSIDPEAATARVWDAVTGARLQDLDGGTKNARSGVAASPAGPVVAVARDDGRLALFDLAAKKGPQLGLGDAEPAKGAVLEVKKRHEVELGEPSHAVAFSKDGALVAAMGGKEAASATLVDATTGEVVRTFEKRSSSDPCPDGALAFSPDGAWLARVAPGVTGVQLFEVSSGKLAKTLGEGAGASVAFAPDGKTIALGLRNGRVLLIDLAGN